jgi:hypothetical protein
VLFVIEKLESLPRAAALFEFRVSDFEFHSSLATKNQETLTTLAASRIGRGMRLGVAIGEASTAIAKTRNFDYFAVMSRRRSQPPAGSMGGAT